jgi:HPr kinase/phosphorylase
MGALRVQTLLDHELAGLQLTLVAGRDGVERELTSPLIQKPGLALTGFTRHLHADRLQVLGLTEIDFLATFDDPEAVRHAEFLMTQRPVCVVVTRGLPVPNGLVVAAERHGVALLRTELTSSLFIEQITNYLEEVLSPWTSVHGVLIDVLGVGILLLGKSGVGKSEAALDLVLRGHRLVADDVVDVRKKHPNYVYGSGSEIIKHHMEIRGLGILNIKDLFGIASVRDTKRIELVVELTEWREDEEYDRLGVDELSYTIVDVRIPMIRIPVRPGRNMTSIIEVAARNQLLKLRGHHSARDFQDRLHRAISQIHGPKQPTTELPNVLLNEVE